MNDSDYRILTRNNRTPKNKDNVTDKAVRESLISESTSGIGRGEEDESNTSVGNDSFSSPEIEISNTECLLSFTKESKKKDCKIEVEKLEENYVQLKIEDELVANGTNRRKESTTKEQSKDEVKIPDGGWGWVVVMSSFIISMIADGISFSFGLLFIEFLEEFQASKSTTAWIGSLFIAVPLLSGPVMSALVDRYGCRKMTILGGIISFLGFLSATFVGSIEMMMLTFGVLAGLGLGLVYVTAVVAIAYWFDKYRNFAVGLGACGTGFGTIVYAPLTQYLIEEYGWRGTILILSGTLLNLCVCGCVMRDPDWWIIEQKKQRNSDDSRSVSISYHNSEIEPLNRKKNMKALLEKGVTPEKVVENEAETIRKQEILLNSTKKEVNSRPRSDSLGDLPTYLTYTDKVSLTRLDFLVKSTSKNYEIEVKYPAFAINRNSNKKTSLMEDQKEDNDPPVVTYPPKQLQRTYSEKYNVRPEKSLEDYQLKNPRQGRVLRKSKSETKEDKQLIKQDSKENRRDWLKKQLSVNHHYMKDLKMPLNSISHRNAILNVKGYRLKASSCPDIFKNSMITIVENDENWYDDCVVCLSDMFNVNLFKKATFNLLCLGTIILFTWFIVPYFYLAEYMVHVGYQDSDGAFMLVLIGVCNTLGMIFLGYIGDLPWVSIGSLYAVCLVLCGVTVAAIPFVTSNFTLLGITSSLFGWFFAASFTFTPSLLVKLVSLEDFTPAYGLVLLAQGIGHLVGPPLSGLIYDLTLSWELSFYLAGGWIIVAGMLISLIHPIKKYNDRNSIEDESSLKSHGSVEYA